MTDLVERTPGSPATSLASEVAVSVNRFFFAGPFTALAWSLLFGLRNSSFSVTTLDRPDDIPQKLTRP